LDCPYVESPEVFETLHGLGPDGQEFPPKTTIQTQLTQAQRADLLTFLKSIDGTTRHFRSEGDEFRDSVRLQGTCPHCHQSCRSGGKRKMENSKSDESLNLKSENRNLRLDCPV